MRGLHLSEMETKLSKLHYNVEDAEKGNDVIEHIKKHFDSDRSHNMKQCIIGMMKYLKVTQ